MFRRGVLPFAAVSLCCLGSAWLVLVREVPPLAPPDSSSASGDYSLKGRRRPLRPDSPLPAAPIPPKGTVEFVLDALSAISGEVDRRKGGCGNVYFGGSRFLFERDFHYREARLLAEAYPEAAEIVAEDLLSAPDVFSFGQNIASNMLGCLSEKGSRRAELLLLRHAGAKPNDPAREFALYALHTHDRECIYGAFYREQWRIGLKWAVGLLDFLPDRETMALLERVSSDPAEPDLVRVDAAQILNRLRILRGPDANARLVEIIMDPPDRADREAESRNDSQRRWALRAARARDLDLRAPLRRRLDRDLASAREERLEVAYAHPSFEEEFNDFVFFFPGDWDDALSKSKLKREHNLTI